MAASRCGCCVPADDDPDAFDAAPFLRRRGVHRGAAATAGGGDGRAAERLRVLCSLCGDGGAAATVGCAARPRRSRAEQEQETGAAVVRLSPDSAPATRDGSGTDSYEPRNIIARGMKRFEIQKIPPPQPDWERLSPTVVCVLGQNPAPYTLNGTNCYIVGTGKRRVLIDAGESPTRDDYGCKKMLPILQRVMSDLGCDGFSHILVTHLHGDHFGGVEAILGAFPGPTAVGMIPASEQSLSVYTIRQLEQRGLVPHLQRGPSPYDNGMWSKARAEGGEITDSSLPPWPDEDLSWDVAGRSKLELQMDFWYMRRHAEWVSRWESGLLGERLALHEGDVIRTEGATLRVMHTPGHAENHAAFALAEEGAIFSGDHVLGYGTTVLSDLRDYMASLHRILSTLQQGGAPQDMARLYAGHGPCIDDGVGLLERYVVHRQQREEQVAFHLAGKGRQSAAEIVDALYLDTPERRKAMARNNVEKILLKLYRDGKARCWRPGGQEAELPRGYVRRLDPTLLWALLERV